MTAKDQTFVIASAEAPKTVLFDPDHEFVREIPKMPWSAAEFAAVFQFAPNPIDREYALSHLLDGHPSAETLRLITAELTKDNAPFPGLPDTAKLASLKRTELHDFWIAETKHANYQRRADAATGLAGVATAADHALLHSLMADDQPYVVVAAALRGLAGIDFPSVKACALKAAQSSPSADLREAALDVLADTKTPGWIEAILDTASDANMTLLRCPGVQALVRLPRDDQRLPDALRSALASPEPPVVASALHAATVLKVKAIVPDLEKLKASSPSAAVDAAIKACKEG